MDDLGFSRQAVETTVRTGLQESHGRGVGVAIKFASGVLSSGASSFKPVVPAPRGRDHTGGHPHWFYLFFWTNDVEKQAQKTWVVAGETPLHW